MTMTQIYSKHHLVFLNQHLVLTDIELIFTDYECQCWRYYLFKRWYERANINIVAFSFILASSVSNCPNVLIMFLLIVCSAVDADFITILPKILLNLLHFLFLSHDDEEHTDFYYHSGLHSIHLLIFDEPFQLEIISLWLFQFFNIVIM